MIAREEKRLRTLFLSMVSMATLGSGGVACSAGDDAGEAASGVDASVDAARDATVVPPGADAGADATSAPSGDAAPIVDAGRDAACDPVFLDGADDGSGCDYFESLACGLPPDSSALDCQLYLPECADLCGSPFGYPCLVVGCGVDGAIPDGPLTLECTTGKVSCPDAGRRPVGLRDAQSARTGTGSALGAWLAETAWLEAASVRAFRDLATELASIGAPRALVRCASRSARDETRHARVMGRLARKRGVAPARVRVARTGGRSVAELARHNAVEGCVRESFGALVATWQAAHAPDADVARAMIRVARDETRHAALAWSIARWLEGSPLLDAGARAHVRAAMRGAVATLRCEVRATPAALAREAGLPHGRQGLALVDALARLLLP